MTTRSATLVILFILSGMKGFSQDIEASPMMELSKNDKLSLAVFRILKANKYLDFRNADTLKQFVAGQLIKTTGLKYYFGYQKDWNKIAQEDTSSYRKTAVVSAPNKYSYSYTPSTMTEAYSDYGAYGVRKDYRLVYNLKGFLIGHEVKVFINDVYVETRITKNIFDEQNRVIKIIERTDKKDGKKDTEAIITASYQPNQITVKVAEGIVICLFSVTE